MADSLGNPVRPTESLTLTERELAERLGWFTQLRWGFGLLCLLLLLVSWHVLDVRFVTPAGVPTIAPAVIAVCAVFLYNAAFVFLVRILVARGRITRRRITMIAAAQLSCDLLATVGLVHQTGGIENFFVVMVLLPMVLATTLLSRRVALGMATVAVVLVNALGWGEWAGVVPHVAIEIAGRPYLHGAHRDAMFVLHMTSAITLAMAALMPVASSITRRLRRRENELEAAYRQLNEIDDVKGFFMRKAGHEMRAPLAAIGSILDAIIAAGEDLDPEQRRLLERAKTRTQALLALVGDLQRYSRVHSTEGLMRREWICLGCIVNNTAELMQRQAQFAGLELHCDAPEIWAHGDETLLREAVTNLVANAVQYTPRGGRIDVRLVHADGEAVLTVADTGIGISDKAAERVFEEFYRSPEAKDFFAGGTGLGLSIVKRIVTGHGGRITAAARDGGGTVFTVTLPVADGPAPGAPGANSRSQGA